PLLLSPVYAHPPLPPSFPTRRSSDLDVKHILDLARYFFPLSLIPRRLRRRALQFGSGLPTQVICSSLIGRAFQNVGFPILPTTTDRKSTRLNSSHQIISYAVFCLKKK